MKGTAVADSGPLHYLVLIDCDFVLELLFNRILIPFAVRDELSANSAPSKVKNWLTNPSKIFEFVNVSGASSIAGLHKGEVEALRLAANMHAACVLIDDMDGRVAAKRLGLTVVGTIGLLERASELIDFDFVVAMEKLSKTNFFVSPNVIEAALARWHNRNKQKGDR